MLREDPSGLTVNVGAIEVSISGTQRLTTTYYFAGGQRIAMRKDGEVTYLHGDHLGSASLATDASGAKVSDMRYTPFGEVRYGDAPTDRKFTGQREESGIGLYDFNARMYSASLGRFISADSIIPDPENSQALNRYAYTLNNPVKYVDPSGHAYCGDPYDPACFDNQLEKEAYAEMTGDDSILQWYPNRYEYEPGLRDAITGIIVDFTPGLGDFKGFVEVITGEDLATGESLGWVRWLGILGLSELRHLRHADEVVDVAAPVGHVVIGEGMEAIKTVARENGAKWYQAWKKFFEPDMFDMGKSLARNERWIRTKIRQGYEILDIGLDSSRATRSPFYALEKRIIEELGYPVTKIPRP